MNKLIPRCALLIVGAATAAQAQVPSNTYFRPSTFARPSAAIRSFSSGGIGIHSQAVRPYIFSYRRPMTRYSHAYAYSSSLSPSAASRSSYYDSVIGNYGPNPFTGLDASEHLYTNPIYVPSDYEPSDSYGSAYSDPYYLDHTLQYGRYRWHYGY